MISIRTMQKHLIGAIAAFYCSFTERNSDPEVFEFSRRVAVQIRRGSDFAFKTSQRTISGSLWCPWQENLLFSAYMGQLHLVDAQR